METLYYDLVNQFGNLTPIALIDEDKGQLEAIINGEDQYPVIFPCLLISIQDIDWSNLSAHKQKGDISISVKLAFDCYNDTHKGSGTEDKFKERNALNKEVNKLINYWEFEGTSGPMIRTHSKQYTMPNNIKVYETTYKCTIEESEE